jgi:Holliday junction DNA helicase RuvB
MRQVRISRRGSKLNLSSLIGLTREKRKARVAIRACVAAGECFPHTLLYGIGGTGKTEFARAIGYELTYHFVEVHAAAFKKREQLFEAILHYSAEAQRLDRPLLFFIDEVHGLKLNLQEALYSVMKEWWIPTDRGKKYVAPFTLMAATTRFDMLDANSFVTRFPNVWEIERYSEKDIGYIVAYEFDRMGLDYTAEVVVDIAKRCLGVPRIAVTLAKKVRTTTLAAGHREVTLEDTWRTFDLEEIDELGLQPVHRRYLQILAASEVNGKLTPLGIGPIAGKMRHHEDMIKGSIEPILLELDFVAPTPRGRVLTARGAKYLEKGKEAA